MQKLRGILVTDYTGLDKKKRFFGRRKYTEKLRRKKDTVRVEILLRKDVEQRSLFNRVVFAFG